MDPEMDPDAGMEAEIETEMDPELDETHVEHGDYEDGSELVSDNGSLSEPSLKRFKAEMGHQNTITTLEPAVTIVRGEADGTTTYYKIISTSTPGASTLPVNDGPQGMESVGKVQLINGSLHFPNGTIVVPSTQPGEILNNSDLASVTTANLLSSQPTMVSVSIPGGSGGTRFRSVAVPDLVNAKRKNQPASRDERRRQTHNEVERRRRDKINSWITKLQALVPAASCDHTKHSQEAGRKSGSKKNDGKTWIDELRGTSKSESKGVVLSKAVDYITHLHEQLAQAKTMKDTSQKMHLLAIENEVYKKQADVLKTYIREKGLELPTNMPTAALNALQELQQGTAILIAQQTRISGK